MSQLGNAAVRPSHLSLPVIDISEVYNDKSLRDLDANLERHRLMSQGRKLSLPVETASSLAPKAQPRRNSDVGKLISHYVEHIGHNNGQQRQKKLHHSKKPSFDVDNADIFIPDAYLEAAKSPGSLREELRQLQTIDECWKSTEDLEDPFHCVDGFPITKTGTDPI